MPQEISLPEQHKASLLLHHLSAKRDEHLIKWLDELVFAKLANIEGLKVKIKEFQSLVDNVEKDIEAVKKHKQEVISDAQTNLETILKKIVTDVGIGPNSKVQLLFEGNEPKILLHE